MNVKRITVFLLLSLLFFRFHSFAAKSLHSDGTIDNSSGTTNKDLVYRDFEIASDGYVTGFIVNTSNHALKSVKLDMWTVNSAETRILWRKSLNIGDMAPQGRYQVKEPYSPLPDNPSSVIFKFRIPGSTNFRNPGQ